MEDTSFCHLSRERNQLLSINCGIQLILISFLNVLKWPYKVHRIDHLRQLNNATGVHAAERKFSREVHLDKGVFWIRQHHGQLNCWRLHISQQSLSSRSFWMDEQNYGKLGIFEGGSTLSWLKRPSLVWGRWYLGPGIFRDHTQEDSSNCRHLK